MKNSKTTTEKKTVKKSTLKNEVEKLQKINLSKYAEKLSKVDVKEKKKKETIYNYPEGFTEQKINSEEGKKFRNKMRNELKRHTNNILVFAKTNQNENLQKQISAFCEFYKTNYRINDFSINSISRKEEEKNADTILMLDIVKELKK